MSTSLDTERPVAVIGAPDVFSPGGTGGILNTSLSPETAIRSGFDVLLVDPPADRRQASDLLRLAEEAGVRVGFPRWLRRQVQSSCDHTLVTIVAGAQCTLDHLLDLAMWLAGARGIQRMEVERTQDCIGLSLRGHAGQLMSIQTTPSLSDVRVALNGGNEPPRLLALTYDLEEGLEMEAQLFSRGGPEAVLLEDSMDLVAVLERVRGGAR